MIRTVELYHITPNLGVRFSGSSQPRCISCPSCISCCASRPANRFPIRQVGFHQGEIAGLVRELAYAAQGVSQVVLPAIRLLALTAQLAVPELSLEARLGIAAQMSFLLTGGEIMLASFPVNEYGRKLWEHPPPSPVLLGVV